MWETWALAFKPLLLAGPLCYILSRPHCFVGMHFLQSGVREGKRRRGHHVTLGPWRPG